MQATGIPTSQYMAGKQPSHLLGALIRWPENSQRKFENNPQVWAGRVTLDEFRSTSSGQYM